MSIARGQRLAQGLLGDEGLQRIEERFALPLIDIAPIGCGTRACAWWNPATGRVIKVTDDEADAAVAYNLARDPANQDVLAAAYNVWVWPQGEDTAYVIEIEALEPVQTGSWQEFIIDHVPRHPDAPSKQWAIEVAREHGVKKTRFYRDLIEWNKKLARAAELSAMTGYNLLMDSHSGNWGFKKGHYGDFRNIRLLDFGYSEAEPPELPRLNPPPLPFWSGLGKSDQLVAVLEDDRWPGTVLGFIAEGTSRRGTVRARVDLNTGLQQRPEQAQALIAASGLRLPGGR